MEYPQYKIMESVRTMLNGAEPMYEVCEVFLTEDSGDYCAFEYRPIYIKYKNIYYKTHLTKESAQVMLNHLINGEGTKI